MRNSLDGQYRYAFQGQEKDPETGMEAFQLRLWDGRIGRWLSPDPYGQFHSPYLGMGNNPISGVDPDGGWVQDPPWWQQVLNWFGSNNDEPVYHAELEPLTINGGGIAVPIGTAGSGSGVIVGAGATSAALAFTVPFMLTGDESAPHVKEYIEKIKFAEFSSEGYYARTWFWQTSNVDIVERIANRKNNSGYYRHYTTIIGITLL